MSGKQSFTMPGDKKQPLNAIRPMAQTSCPHHKIINVQDLKALSISQKTSATGPFAFTFPFSKRIKLPLRGKTPFPLFNRIIARSTPEVKRRNCSLFSGTAATVQAQRRRSAFLPEERTTRRRSTPKKRAV